jgi:hypothetical protein
MQLYRWEQRKDLQREKDKHLKTYRQLALTGDETAIYKVLSMNFGF